MSAKNMGMSAFPCEQHETSDGTWNQTHERGMTLRDYFAAHAPADPQPWFLPTMPPRPKSKWIDEDGKEYSYRWEAEEAVVFDGYVDANLEAGWACGRPNTSKPASPNGPTHGPTNN